MVDLNEKIVSWFEKGYFREALLGEGNFFLSHHTYRGSHNVLLVMSVLLKWANNKNIAEKIGKQFQGFVESLAKDDPTKCIEILMAYGVISESNNIDLKCDLSVSLNNIDTAIRDRELVNKESPINYKVVKKVKERLEKVGAIGMQKKE